jgi:CBS domain-containing protein
MTTTAIAPTLLAATVQDLRRHVPFSEMELPHVEWMAGRLQLDYFPAGTTVLEPAAGVPQWFYVVKQGSVEAGGISEDSVIKLLAGECFPLGALLAGRAVSNQFRAAEDSFCYLLATEDFHALLGQSAVFRDFCTRRIASLLEQSQKAVQSEYALRQDEDTRLERSLASICARKPVSVNRGSPRQAALKAMHDARVGSVAVTDGAGQALGILTLKDVLSRVTLPGLALDTPIETVMTASPVTLPAAATAREALLATPDLRLLVARAAVARPSPCEPVVEHATVELGEGFARLLPHLDGRQSVSGLLDALRGAGADDGLLAGVLGGFRELARQGMLQLANGC